MGVSTRTVSGSSNAGAPAGCTCRVALPRGASAEPSPVMEKVASARKNLKASEKTMAHLSELCSRYALGHEGVFATKRLVPNQQGVKTGDVVLDEATYHFASGYDGYVRGRREKMTQEFLASLPEKWCRQKLELNVSGINENAPSDAELAEHGLVQKPNNVWSLAEQGDGE